MGSSALLVKVTENRRKHYSRRRILAIRRTGSMPNFARMLRSHPVFIKNAGEPNNGFHLRVRMTDVQARTAVNEGDRFLLCVVPVDSDSLVSGLADFGPICALYPASGSAWPLSATTWGTMKRCELTLHLMQLQEFS